MPGEGHMRASAVAVLCPNHLQKNAPIGCGTEAISNRGAFRRRVSASSSVGMSERAISLATFPQASNRIGQRFTCVDESKIDMFLDHLASPLRQSG